MSLVGSDGSYAGKAGLLDRNNVSCNKESSILHVKAGSKFKFGSCNNLFEGLTVELSEHGLSDEGFYAGVKWLTCRGMEDKNCYATILLIGS